MMKLISFLALMSLLSPPALAKQLAEVIVPSAFVYADQEAKLPIGRVAKRKTLWVGDIPRNYGMVFPLVVAGKIAYIKKSDIILLSEQDKKNRQLKQNIRKKARRQYLEQEKEVFDLTIDNSLIFSLGQQHFGGWVKNLASNRPAAAHSFYLGFEHRASFSWAWGAALAYYQQRNAPYTVKTLTLEGELLWRPLDNKFLALDFMVGPDLSADIRLVIDDGQVYRGTLYGFHGGPRLHFFPELPLHFFVGLSYRYWRINGMGDIKLSPSSSQVVRSDTIKGIHYFLGIKYNL